MYKSLIRSTKQRSPGPREIQIHQIAAQFWLWQGTVKIQVLQNLHNGMTRTPSADSYLKPSASSLRIPAAVSYPKPNCVLSELMQLIPMRLTLVKSESKTRQISDSKAQQDQYLLGLKQAANPRHLYNCFASRQQIYGIIVCVCPLRSGWTLPNTDSNYLIRSKFSWQNSTRLQKSVFTSSIVKTNGYKITDEKSFL